MATIGFSVGNLVQGFGALGASLIATHGALLDFGEAFFTIDSYYDDAFLTLAGRVPYNRRTTRSRRAAQAEAPPGAVELTPLDLNARAQTLLPEILPPPPPSPVPSKEARLSPNARLQKRWTETFDRRRKKL